MFSKAKTLWYNIIPSDVVVSEVWPNRTVAQGQEQVTVLNVDYDPTKKGEYNYSLGLGSTLRANPQKNWGGMMRLLSATANNLVDENINFIEVWAKVIGNGNLGKMVIDLGQISEDVIPNGRLDTEDGINPAFPVKNGILNDGEDVGLDGLTDDQERQVYAEFIRLNPEYASDPSGDDWNYVQGSLDFSKINGTEGNGQSEVGRFPDTEDLNRNGIADLVNSYFEYEVNLDTTGGLSKNPLIVGGGSNGWYQFRIPLIDFTRKIGEPSFSVVEFIRVWFTGFDQPVIVRIADFNLVGNQWQEAKKNDSTFSVTTVNIEDNPEYRKPPGVIREQDRTRPDQKILANEQSLALVFNNISDGESRQAIRFFSSRPLDVFNYKDMRMFVHGDPRLRFTDTTNYDIELFVRFGLDTLNFYEYREPVRPGDATNDGWDPLNNVQIEFSEITSVKQGRDSVTGVTARYPVRNGAPGATYSVRGNPTLTQIRFISIGIENPRNKGTPLPISGQIWVNELRLSGVDDEPGFAYRLDAGIKIADIATIGLNLSKVDPTFHALDQRFGGRSTGINWGVNANISMEKFLPENWTGTTIPFSYSHIEGINKPKYLPGTDVLVAEAAQRQGEFAVSRGAPPEYAKVVGDSIIVASQTLRVSDSWAIPTARLQLPSDKWYVQDILDKLSLGLNYNSVRERSPVTESRQSWAWAGRLSYAHAFSPENYFAPFSGFLGSLPLLGAYKDLKIYFTPSTLSWGVGAQRGQSRERVRTQEGDRPVVRNFTADRSLAFAWKLTEGGLMNLSADYGLQISSSLVHLETDSSGNQRSFSKILSDIFFGARLINFGLDYSYSQRFSLTPRLKVPPLFNLDRYLDLTSNYRSDYQWQNNLQQAPLGKASTVTSQFSFGINFRLKQLTDPWFSRTESAQVPQPLPAVGDRGDSRREKEADKVKEERERKEKEKKEQEKKEEEERKDKEKKEKEEKEKKEREKKEEEMRKEEERKEEAKKKVAEGKEEGGKEAERKKEEERMEEAKQEAENKEQSRKEEEKKERKKKEEEQKEQERKEKEQRDQAQPQEKTVSTLSVKEILRILIKLPFLDYDNINMNFVQQNSAQNTGLRGRTGFDNFWGRFPFFQKSILENGPSRLYQLGFISDPSASVTSFGLRKTFPFFGVRTERGLRAPGGNLIDNFTQTNKLDFKTTRELFQGFRVDLTWKVGWSYNRNQTLTSDSATGAVTVRSVLTTGDVERSYFSFPEVFSVKLFKNNIVEVARRFKSLRDDAGDTRPDEEKLAEAFEDGFETLPILKKVFGRFVPRANWTVRWEGLEKLPFLKNFANRVSLEHAYTSAFNRRWRGNLGGGEITESQRMSYGFTPLAGLNLTFQDFLKGNFGGTLRYSSTTTYDLSTASRNIIETYSREISVTANFSRKGFAIPFFGLTLTNDIDMTFSYTYSRNTRSTFDIANIEAGGVPLEGLTRTVIEPRIKYVLSARVSASLFYRYTNVEPDRGASRIPGTKTNEAGLDVHIAIQ